MCRQAGALVRLNQVHWIKPDQLGKTAASESNAPALLLHVGFDFDAFFGCGHQHQRIALLQDVSVFRL